jgi:hypothetical protein
MSAAPNQTPGAEGLLGLLDILSAARVAPRVPVMPARVVLPPVPPIPDVTPMVPSTGQVRYPTTPPRRGRNLAFRRLVTESLPPSTTTQPAPKRRNITQDSSSQTSSPSPSPSSSSSSPSPPQAQAQEQVQAQAQVVTQVRPPLGICSICLETIECPVTYCGFHWNCLKCICHQMQLQMLVKHDLHRVDRVTFQLVIVAKETPNWGLCPECRESIAMRFTGMQGSYSQEIVPLMTKQMFNCPFNCTFLNGQTLSYMKMIQHMNHCKGFATQCENCCQRIGFSNPTNKVCDIKNARDEHHQSHIKVCPQTRCPFSGCTFIGKYAVVKTHYSQKHEINYLILNRVETMIQRLQLSAADALTTDESAMKVIMEMHGILDKLNKPQQQRLQTQAAAATTAGTAAATETGTGSRQNQSN